MEMAEAISFILYNSSILTCIYRTIFQRLNVELVEEESFNGSRVCLH